MKPFHWTLVSLLAFLLSLLILGLNLRLTRQIRNACLERATPTQEKGVLIPLEKSSAPEKVPDNVCGLPVVNSPCGCVSYVDANGVEIPQFVICGSDTYRHVETSELHRSLESQKILRATPGTTPSVIVPCEFGLSPELRKSFCGDK